MAVGGDGGGLRGAPVVYVADSMDAADGAVGGAALGGEEFALDVGGGVVGEGNAGVAALLAAVVDQAVFTNVEIAGAGAAAPVVGTALGYGFLKFIELCVVSLFAVGDGKVDFGLIFLKGLELAAAIVDDTDGGLEA